MQPEVLRVTGLTAPVLQTWVNRGAIVLSEQNPGTGRRRFYSKLDVVKLAIMRRMADFRIELSDSKKIAELAAEELAERGAFPWNFVISIKPSRTVPTMATSPWIDYAPTVGDPRKMSVADFTEGHLIDDRRDRSDRRKENRPVDEDAREALARAGWHAEPVLIFPLGEVINGVLAQLRDIDEDVTDQERLLRLKRTLDRPWGYGDMKFDEGDE